MTNIPAGLTIGKLQKVAHPHEHTIVLRNSCNDKDYWQKIWRIDRFTKALGFEEVKQP